MNLFPKKDVKLELFSGIGDSLNTLCIWNRIPAYCQRHSVKCFITYGRIRDCGWELMIKDLINRVDYLEYVERDQFDLKDALLIIPDNMGWHNYPIVPMQVMLRPEEEFQLGTDKKNIALQLRGNDRVKYWDISKVVELITLLQDRYDIYVYDKPEFVDANRKALEDAGAIVFSGNLAQCYNLVQRCDILVSPDSWSKFVCRTMDKRQILLCTQVGYMTQEYMFQCCFNMIYGNPNVTIVGYKEDGRLVDNINEIDVGKVVEVI